MVDTAKLTGERLAEFDRDRKESNRRYDHAFQVVLSHTSAVELEEFWRLFSKPTALDGDQVTFAFSNPILADAGGRGPAPSEDGPAALVGSASASGDGEQQQRVL